MAEVRYHGVNHLALVTNDMDKTVRFYKDVLGMKVVGTLAGGSGSNRMRHYFFSLGPGSTIAFFEWPWVELLPPKNAGAPASGRNFDHVSVTVESEDDFAAIRERMAKAGLSVSDTVDHGMVRYILRGPQRCFPGVLRVADGPGEGALLDGPRSGACPQGVEVS